MNSNLTQTRVEHCKVLAFFQLTITCKFQVFCFVHTPLDNTMSVAVRLINLAFKVLLDSDFSLWFLGV